MVYFSKIARKSHAILVACTHLKFKKQLQIRSDLHLEAGPFQNSGKILGFIGPAVTGIFHWNVINLAISMNMLK